MSSINILHLSDLHYGVQDAGGGSKDLANLHKRAIDGLIDTLRTIPEEHPDWKPDIIAITGDIAWAAKESDYDQAAEFIKELLTIFDLAPEYVILCPGNHDVDLELNKFKVPIQSQEDSEEHLSVDAIKHRVEPFKNFVKFSKDLGIPPLQNSVDDDNIIHYLYGCRDIRGIRFAVFNTAWNVRKKKKQDQKESLWIGALLTNDVIQQPKDPSNDLFVSLFHHPFRYLDDSECRSYDQNLVVSQDILEFSDVILNGHVHGDICAATFMENKAHTFISSTAFDKDSTPKGCQIIRIDRSRRCYSTKVIRYNHRRKWVIEDLEAEGVSLDSTTAQPVPAETAIQLPPKTAGWWLPSSWDPLGLSPLPIDDGASLCLLSFLLARTDPYVIVLASDAEVKLVELLSEESQHLKEFADASRNTTYTPRTWSVFQGTSSFKGLPGIVITISAAESTRLRTAIDGYGDLRGQEPNAAIVYCIWSDSLKAAASSAQRFANELRKQIPNVDVMALSVRKDLDTYDVEKAKEAADYIEELNCNQTVSPTEEVNALLHIRDEKPELWPYVLRRHADFRKGKYRILGFTAACHTQSDVETWFESIRPGWFQDQGVELDPFADLLFRNEAKRLVWGIYQKVCFEKNEELRQSWDRILDAQLATTPSVMDLLSLLKGQEVDADAVCPEDASQWARNASKEEFQGLLPELLKQGLPVYWAALLASPYGRPYILRELSGSDKMQCILNADEGKSEDPHWQELLSSLRQISRPYN